MKYKFLGTILICALTGCSGIVRREFKRNKPSFQVGVNFYPRGKMWQDFWSRYDKGEIENDFRQLRDLDLNLVRVFLHQAVFVGDRTRPGAMENLEHLITTAEKYNIRLIVTAFDWAKPYRIDLKQSERNGPFQTGLLQPMAKHANRRGVFAWDIKNEPDHDFKFEDRQQVLSWLKEAASIIKMQFPEALTTIGWLHLQKNSDVNDELSFLSFHHFPEQGLLKNRIREFTDAFPGRKIFLEEIGFSTATPEEQNPDTQILTEKKQLFFISDAIYQSLASQLDGMLIWNLYDHPPNIGPTRPPNENKFGIIRVDGTLKPISLALKSGIYPNSCSIDDEPEKFWGFCANAAGDGSEIKTYFRHSSGQKIATDQFKLDRGFHCFCFDSIPGKILSGAGFSLTIQHKGLTTVNGRAPINPGEWNLRSIGL